MPKGPHNRPTIAKAEWVAEAVRLSNRGWSFQAIADRLGKAKSTVWEAFQAEFERVRAPAEEVEMMRNVQRGQIARQLRAWIPRSLKGNKDAALVVVRFLDRAAKLDGLDAPSRSEISGADGAPIMLDTTGMTVDDLARLLAAVEPNAESGVAGATEGGPGEEDRGGKAGT